MVFDYYEYFYRVTVAGNISKAAEEIHISQSALSKAISKLEKMLDCQLFVRSSKGVKLTPAGEVLFQGFEESMRMMEKTNQRIQMMKHMDIGEILISSGEDLFRYFMIPIIKEFHENYPNVLIKVRGQFNSDECLQALMRDDVEIGLVNKQVENSVLEYRLIKRMDEVFIAGKKYAKMIGDGPFAWERLVDYPLILHPKYTYTRRRFEEKLKSMSLAVLANFEVASTDSMMHMVLEDFGIALVTKEIAQMNPLYHEVKELRMTTPYEGRDSFVVWRKDRKVSEYGKLLIESIVSKGTSSNA